MWVPVYGFLCEKSWTHQHEYKRLDENNLYQDPLSWASWGKEQFHCKWSNPCLCQINGIKSSTSHRFYTIIWSTTLVSHLAYSIVDFLHLWHVIPHMYYQRKCDVNPEAPMFLRAPCVSAPKVRRMRTLPSQPFSYPILSTFICLPSECSQGYLIFCILFYIVMIFETNDLNMKYPSSCP